MSPWKIFGSENQSAMLQNACLTELNKSYLSEVIKKLKKFWTKSMGLKWNYEGKQFFFVDKPVFQFKNPRLIEILLYFNPISS